MIGIQCKAPKNYENLIIRILNATRICKYRKRFCESVVFHIISVNRINVKYLAEEVGETDKVIIGQMCAKYARKSSGFNDQLNIPIAWAA